MPCAVFGQRTYFVYKISLGEAWVQPVLWHETRPLRVPLNVCEVEVLESQSRDQQKRDLPCWIAQRQGYMPHQIDFVWWKWDSVRGR
jgi:hypothetical protein